MTSLLQLGAGLDGLIYLIVIVVWVIAQISSARNKRKEAAPPPSEPTGRSPMEEELKDLFKEITGSPAPERTSSAPPSVLRRRRQAMATRPARDASTQAAPRPPPLPADEEEPLPVFSTAPQMEPMTKPTRISSQGLHVKSMPIGLMSIDMPGMRLGLTPPDIEQVVPPIDLRTLRHRETLKHAILYNAILGPPKALQNHPPLHE